MQRTAARLRASLLILIAACLLAACGGDEQLDRLVQARENLDLDLFAEAEQILQEILSGEPTNRRANEMLSELYVTQRRYEDAIKHLEGAVASAPDERARADYQRRLGAVYLERARDWHSEGLNAQAEWRKEYEQYLRKAIEFSAGTDRLEALQALAGHLDARFERLARDASSDMVTAFVNDAKTTERELREAGLLEAPLLSAELRGRMARKLEAIRKAAIEELKRKELAEMTARLDAEVKPMFADNPLINFVQGDNPDSLEDDRFTITLPVPIPLTPENVQQFKDLQRDQPEEAQKQIDAVAKKAREQMARVISNIIPKLLPDIEAMRAPLKSSAIVTFKVDPEKDIAFADFPEEPGKKQLLITASISVSELIDLTFDYAAYHRTGLSQEDIEQERQEVEAAQQEQRGGADGAADGGAAAEGASTADGRDAPSTDGGDGGP